MSKIDHDDDKVEVAHYQNAEITGKDTLLEAITAENTEHSTGFWTALRTHKKACGWSIAVSMCIVRIGD